MNKLKKIFSGLAVSVLALVLSSSPSFAASSIVYNAIPATLPPNMASLGYEATSTSEFGDLVSLAGTNRNLNTVTVTMSDWALQSDYPTLPLSGWTHPITVNVYSSHLDSNGVPDTKLATTTQPITIPWRPAADPTCAGGTAWRADDGLCYNGKAFNATFDFSNQNIVLPHDVIVGIAYNTADYGSNPIHQPGPYNSLNVGVDGVVTVGTDVNPDSVFWNTSYAGFYTDGGTAGVGIFRQDTGWSGYALSIKIDTITPTLTDKSLCKQDGWKTFNGAFKNQGDCVSSVVSNGKN